MKKPNLRLLLAVITVMVLSACGKDEPVTSATMGEGHCLLDKINEGADPTPMCAEPMDEATCGLLAVTYGEAARGFAEYSGGIYGKGGCPAERLVATCDKGDSKDLYYGNVDGMKIGCRFSGGDWIEL